MKTYVIGEFSEFEKIVEFEIPTFGKTETCTVLEFSKDENEELEIEIPAFMRG